MEVAVSAVLDRDDFSRPYSAGRVWKLACSWRGSKPSRKPVLWLEAFPIATGIPGSRRRQFLPKMLHENQRGGQGL